MLLRFRVCVRCVLYALRQLLWRVFVCISPDLAAADAHEARVRLCSVGIRCCPTKNSPVIQVDGPVITLQRPKTTLSKAFQFAQIHPATAGNGEVHGQAVSPHVRHAIAAGEHVTVLTFGARATGKTHTMRSSDGLVLRAATDVFAVLGETDAGPGGKRMVTVSCLISAVAPPAQSNLTGRQVTHEILLDGMLPQGDVGDYKGGLHVREHPSTGFYVEGLSEIAVDSLAECEEYLRRALRNCAAEETRCGSATKGSPLRVHCLFTIRVRQQSADGERVSDVQLLDLAGWVRDKPASKMAPAPAAVVGEDMVVKAFQRIVGNLETKAGHIPYRDSKMTRLLQSALGGCALCIPLVHIAADNYEETEAMLSLATRLASITCTVRSNLVVSSAEVAVRQKRVDALCKKLGRRREGLKAADIILGMNSSDDLLELRETLAGIEQTQRDRNTWARTAEASAEFKADDGATATANRVDRKAPRAPRFEELPGDAPGSRPLSKMEGRPLSVLESPVVRAAGRRDHAELGAPRSVPPARGHGNETPRGDTFAHPRGPPLLDAAAYALEPMESARTAPPRVAPASQPKRRDVRAASRGHEDRGEGRATTEIIENGLLQKEAVVRRRMQHLELRAQENHAPDKRVQDPGVGTGDSFGGGGRADMAARLALLQQSSGNQSSLCHDTASHPTSAGGGRVQVAQDVSARLAMLQSKPVSSRLRTLSR